MNGQIRNLFWPTCVYTSEAWHTDVVNNTNPQNFLLLYQIGLKLFVGTVLTSRQIHWSPNFSRTIDIDAIGKWGEGLVLPHCIEIWGGGIRPPCLIACSTLPLCGWRTACRLLPMILKNCHRREPANPPSPKTEVVRDFLSYVRLN